MQWPKSFNEQLKIIQNDVSLNTQALIFVHDKKLKEDNKFFHLIDYLMDGVLSNQLANGHHFDGPHWLSGEGFKNGFHIIYLNNIGDWDTQASKYLKILDPKLAADDVISICSEQENLNVKKLQSSHQKLKFTQITFDH